MIFITRECEIHGHLHRIRYVPNGSNFFVGHRLQSLQETARWLCSPKEYLKLLIKISYVIADINKHLNNRDFKNTSS